MGPERMADTLRWRIMKLGLLCEGGLLLVGLALAWLCSLPWERWALTPASLTLGFAAVAPLLVVLFLTVTFPVGPLERIDRMMEYDLLPYLRHCTLLDLAVLSLLAGFGEEAFFRGVLQVGLVNWLGIPAGVALASIVFGLAHLITPTYAVLVTLVGLYFGALLVWSDSLLAVSLAHAVYDFIALLYLVRVRQPDAERPAPAPEPADTGNGDGAVPT